MVSEIKRNTDFMKRNTNTVLQTYFDFSKIVMILLFLEHYRIARKIGIEFFELQVVMKELNEWIANYHVNRPWIAVP